MKANSILDTIGNTPHVRLNRLFDDRYEVWMKMERANPGGSIKDRIALAMVSAAEASGQLKPGGTIVEPTSGNTGIGLAMVAAVRGYKVVLTMPESMSVERRRAMKAYGAELILTPKEEGVKGAIAAAQAYLEENPGAWMPMQFENEANVRVHREVSGAEILADFPEGLDAMVTGVGTGGHITGAGLALKEAWPSVKIYAVEPEKSQVIGGGEHSPHKLQGIGAGFVPSILDRSVLDGTVAVSEEEAFAMAQRAAREEGIWVGTSSGASLAAVAKVLGDLPVGSRVLTWCYDTGERYLSVEGLFEG